MKKLLSIALAACLIASLILPCAAADTDLNNRLAKVTQSAKQTLGIDDTYTEFAGRLTEGEPADQWSLSWKGDKGTIDVTVTDAGKIVSYYRSVQAKPYMAPSGELKRFPKLSRTQAKQIAQSFLAKVLDSKLESATLEEGTNRLAIYDQGDYHFYGSLKINGLSSPVYLNLSVNSANQAVTSFYRGDGGVDYASYPASSKISKDAAASTLFGAVTMELGYYLDEKSENKAILRYLPVMKGDYVLDALTGQLVEQLPQYLYREAAKDAAGSPTQSLYGGLTDVELKAVGELEGALSSSELEAAVRRISALGISSSYRLNRINYYTEKQDSETILYASLSFLKQAKQKESNDYAEKNVMVNAKTGEFVSSWAYAYSDQKPTSQYSRSRCETIARSFATQYHPEELKLTALSEEQGTTTDRYETFSFVRQANGIPFPANGITVTVDTVDGSVGSYYVNWNKDVTFADSTGMKTAEEAKAIYEKAVGLSLCYKTVSTENQKDSQLRLVYDFADESTWGIDAMSGKPLQHEPMEDAPLAYGDIAGHFAKKQIEALSDYGIGYTGGSFAPNQTLNQKDALTLIVAASGYSLNQEAEDYEENLYSAAYSMGLLEKTERAPTAAVTRASLTKMLVDAAGYGEVAKLKNIYRIGFRDEKAISADLIGYVAIAKGLGIIQGDNKGNFNPNITANRYQLAIMLYNIMSR